MRGDTVRPDDHNDNHVNDHDHIHRAHGSNLSLPLRHQHNHRLHAFRRQHRMHGILWGRMCVALQRRPELMCNCNRRLQQLLHRVRLTTPRPILTSSPSGRGGRLPLSI